MCSYLFILILFVVLGKEKFGIEEDVFLYVDDVEVDAEAFEVIKAETKTFSLQTSFWKSESTDDPQSQQQPTTSRASSSLAHQGWYSLPDFSAETQAKLDSICSLPQEDRKEAGRSAMLDVTFVHSIVNTLAGDLLTRTSDDQP